MKEITGKLSRRIRSSTGETIGETLVALLIGALALTMLAAAVFSASNMILDNRKAIDSYYTKTDKMASFADADSKTNGVTISGSSGSGTFSESYDVVYVKNAAFTKWVVVSYKIN